MKIHHTNRTMNATFNLKRFLLLEQYKRNETGRHLLWSAAVVSFICILCILYDINRGGSYYGKHTSATEFSRYVLWFILIAPCLLETNFSKRSSTLDILLPASAFEKFLHIFVGSIAVCIGIVTFVASLMPEARADGYWIDNIATWPNTNYPLSAGTQAIVTFCNYAAPISVLLGSWVSSYFLLKEKQL